MGVIAAATGDTASKYVARRETPLYIPENCTQCMECIFRLPRYGAAQLLAGPGTLLSTAVSRLRGRSGRAPQDALEAAGNRKLTRQRMLADIRRERRCRRSFARSPKQSTDSRPRPRRSFFSIIEKVPMAYQKVNAIFSSPERKAPELAASSRFL